MIDIVVDTAKLNRLKEKAGKYAPYAMNAGLNAINGYLNQPSVKQAMYPPSQSGQKFVWSSDKQRRFVFANVSLPSVRTFNLANAGQFTVNSKYFTIEYKNTSGYSQYVIHPSYQIIGHRMRGWIPINTFIVTKVNRAPLMRLFKDAAIKAWDDMDTFIFSGGAGL